MGGFFDNNKNIKIYSIIIMLIVFSIIPLNYENNYLTSTLLYIRILNIVLSFLALSGTYIIHNKNKNSIVFILGLMYLCFSIDIIVGNLDYFIFNEKEFSFSNYINILPSILRIVFLIVAVNPDSKLHMFIYKNGKQAVVFVFIYCYTIEILNELFSVSLILDKNYFFVIYNIILICIYLYTSLRLWLLSEESSFILRYFSVSIFLLVIKAIHAIYGYFNINFNVKLISVSISSLFFLVIIVATIAKLYTTVNEYHGLNNDLMKFFSFVNNNKYSNMFICDYEFNIIYVNMRIREEYAFENVEKRLKNDLLNNFAVFNKLKEIYKSLNLNGYWSGIINDNLNNSILDCYIQVLDDKKTIKQILVSYVDISSKIELEESLESLRLRDVQKDEFISNMSHELKTPINIFYSTLQLLESYTENNSDEFRELFFKHNKSMKLNCKRMIRLINNLVDISRIDLGILKPNYGNYNIVLLTEDIVNSIIPFAMSKNLFLEFDTNSEEHYIKCDPIIIEKILLNILSNSIKYSKPNKRIFILLFVKEDEVTISVTDEGVGIDIDDQQTIFGRFIRADNSFTRLNEGCGIGLSIVKAMLEVIGGDIALESEVGKGSTFVISLPNKLIEEEEIKNYKYESHYNISIELSDIYEIN